MTSEQAKLQLLYKLSEGLNLLGVDHSIEGDNHSGEIIVDFDGYTLVIRSDKFDEEES